jgi:hypothetical protein
MAIVKTIAVVAVGVVLIWGAGGGGGQGQRLVVSGTESGQAGYRALRPGASQETAEIAWGWMLKVITSPPLIAGGAALGLYGLTLLQ